MYGDKAEAWALLTLSSCHPRTESQVPCHSHLDKTNSSLRETRSGNVAPTLHPILTGVLPLLWHSLRFLSLTFTLEQLISVQVPILLVIRAKGI